MQVSEGHGKRSLVEMADDTSLWARQVAPNGAPFIAVPQAHFECRA
ncbi:hypothetical protein HFN88_31085 [Rhizobium laguerreae]|nr:MULTISPECIES: hypothetical protein [Rhizobium]MBB3525857.1 hypothetical protein [Rhizobium sp. BK456]MBY3397095.1 hypothetical protein [Rhizobium laguerreae]MBY3418367.1 hypothetical protein [Rhizobium laguerreae]MBY3425359.1 hypothetical protein [Rhizobium laguerreae]MBY3502765.1 hypothetical protein [Rhizobium laguerreae]